MNEWGAKYLYRQSRLWINVYNDFLGTDQPSGAGFRTTKCLCPQTDSRKFIYSKINVFITAFLIF